jgi:predicted aldo/keto reductase-like oxidoreductase
MADLKKRRLGKTNLMVTELGLGAMDTPQVPEGEDTLQKAIDSGVNFIDTAREYEKSEYLLGQVLRTRSNQELHIATKTMSRSVNGSQYDVDRSLSILGVDHIDLYQLHDVSSLQAWEDVMGENGALAGLKIAQARGLVKHIGISSHNLNILDLAIRCGEFGAVMLEYSAFYNDTEPLIELAMEHDIGVIVMRPLGGSGRTSAIRTQMQATQQKFFLTPKMLLRYVFSNPKISVAIPGARYPERIQENVELASNYQPLDEVLKRQCEQEAVALF